MQTVKQRAPHTQSIYSASTMGHSENLCMQCKFALELRKTRYTHYVHERESEWVTRRKTFVIFYLVDFMRAIVCNGSMNIRHAFPIKYNPVYTVCHAVLTTTTPDDTHTK